jgi:hypothetical protein
MIRWMFRWLFTGELLDAYSKGWKDGVNQEHYEPESSEHGLISTSMYWTGEEISHEG